MEDIFSHFGDIFGGGFGGFEGFGGGSRGGRRHVNKGSDLRVKVKLTLKEIATGVEKKIKVPKYVSCSHCNGTGAENGTAYTTCSKCNGSGVSRSYAIDDYVSRLRWRGPYYYEEVSALCWGRYRT